MTFQQFLKMIQKQGKSYLPVLNNVCFDFDNRHVTYNNMDLAIRYDMDSSFTGSGLIIIDMVQLKSISTIKKLDNTYINSACLMIGGLSLSSSGTLLENLPTCEEFTTARREHTCPINSDTLKTLQPFAGTEETRNYLGGVYFDKTNNVLVATDGHVLLKNKHPIPGGILESFILPNFAIKSLCVNKNIDYYYTSNGKRAVFRADNITLVTKLVDGAYPDYERVIPAENDKAVLLDVDQVLSYAKFAKKSLSKRGSYIVMESEGNRLKISARDENIKLADAFIDCKNVSDFVTMGFYIPVLLRAFEPFKNTAGLVSVNNSSDRNITLRSDDFTSVAMKYCYKKEG